MNLVWRQISRFVTFTFGESYKLYQQNATKPKKEKGVPSSLLGMNG